MSLLFNLGTPALKAISGAVSTSTAEVEDLSGEDIVKMLQGQSQAISNFARTAGQNSRVQAIKQRIDQTQGTNEQTQAQEQTYLEENT
jgi:TolA-binding protein